MSRKYMWMMTPAVVLLAVFAVHGAEPAKEGVEVEEEEEIDYKTLKSPVPYTEQSIARGRMLYMRRCTECHGPDGRSQIDVIADATDLTTPQYWLSGTSAGEIFRSIKEGAGIAMPPFKMQISRDEDMWHMVNFIYSLWPKDKRPELVEEAEASEDTDDQEQKPSGDGDGNDE